MKKDLNIVNKMVCSFGTTCNKCNAITEYYEIKLVFFLLFISEQIYKVSSAGETGTQSHEKHSRENRCPWP